MLFVFGKIEKIRIHLLIKWAIFTEKGYANHQVLTFFSSFNNFVGENFKARAVLNK
jgi:hypothetical protein